MLPTKFRIIWTSGFRGEDFQKSTNQKQELPVVAMFVNGSGRNEHSLQRTAHRCFLPSFGSFGQAVSEEKNLKNQPIRNKSQSCLWRPCDQQSLQRTFHRCFQPSFGSFRQAVSEEKIWKSTNKKQEWPVAVMFVNGSGQNDQSLQRTCHRCFIPSFVSFDQAFSEEKIFKNRPIRHKNCLWGHVC